MPKENPCKFKCTDNKIQGGESLAHWIQEEGHHPPGPVS